MAVLIGAVKGYKTYVTSYPSGMVDVKVEHDAMDFFRTIASDIDTPANRKRLVSFAKRLAKKNGGEYLGYKKITRTKSGRFKHTTRK